jgi:hypothetical protein
MTSVIESAKLEKDTYIPIFHRGHRWFLVLVVFFCPYMPDTQAAQQAGVVFGPQYEYRTEVNNNVDLCGHMLKVFNTHFRALWNTEPLTPGHDPNYSPLDGKYAFSRAEGVGHDKMVTFDMRHSKFPSSPEFDAVQWIETRAANDLPSWNGALEPVLIAHVDIDNDGNIDTVVKSGFTRGYAYMANSTGDGHYAEKIFIWRRQRLPIEVLKSLWILQPVNRVSSRTTYLGPSTYQRPFVYQGKTYVANYDMNIGEEGEALNKPPYVPAKETMTVRRFEASDRSGDPVAASWVGETECLFNMIQFQTKKQ